MSYRDDLVAAHARIESLETELALERSECARLRAALQELRDGREADRQASHERELAKEDEHRLREKMQREQHEVEDRIKKLLR